MVHELLDNVNGVCYVENMERGDAAMIAKPKRAKRKMMHVVDCGSGMAKFECRCGHKTGWVGIEENESVSSLKKGRTCPKCNPST